MPTDALLALASLRRQAETDARELFNAMQLCGMSMAESWEALSGIGKTVFIESQTELLADLTRWQSQAWAIEEIAKAAKWSKTDVMRAVFDRGHMLSGLYRAVGLSELERWEPTPQPIAALTAILLHLEAQQ